MVPMVSWETARPSREGHAESRRRGRGRPRLAGWDLRCMTRRPLAGAAIPHRSSAVSEPEDVEAWVGAEVLRGARW